ncbi:Na+/H+ antiporter [Chitinophaga sp. GCM10012297]|uniref:Na+/H+ antiporter n=1 Tax=Chitinophaga chungangae TaxID=2821488 RepID=A0ABS3YJW9_9BACT|nr:Na+/H+ antiporter [Chitinophaga chungangae]MBO9154979.1 Na+/H+ antiporter [Chitinophaga chungangae]
MQQFDAVILSLVVLIALSTFEGRLKFPFPILLVITGAVLGLIPQFPILMLDPDVVFLIFLPPLLFDAASRTSWHDFRKDILPISTLAIALVFFTTVTVALAAYYFIPGFSWPLAFVLGAIVSPPDAVAATGITKGLGLNKRVVTIIEGESLVNDASALIGYRFALIAVNTGTFVFWQAGLQFSLLVAGGILCGVATGYIFVWMHKKITRNSITSTSLTLLTPFISYILAERLHVSGVLAVVCTGLFIAWRSPKIFSYQTRIRSKSVWDTLIYILNGFIFLLIGQQLPDALKELGEYSLPVLLAYGLLISVVVIVVRIVWVFATAFSHKLVWGDIKTVGSKEIQDEGKTTWKNVLIVAWTGTRGIVSMATALALPLTLTAGASFPHRSLILFLTFVVIFVTLVIQGMSLPLMIRILGVKPNLRSDKEEEELQKFVLQSTLYFIEHEFPIPLEESIKRQIKAVYEETLRQLQQKIKDGKNLQLTNLEEEPWLTVPVAPILLAQLEISKFRRGLLLRLHKNSRYNYESIRKLEQQLDRDDLNLNDVLKREDE